MKRAVENIAASIQAKLKNQADESGRFTAWLEGIAQHKIDFAEFEESVSRQGGVGVAV